MIPAERFPKELAQLESEEPTLSDPLEMGSLLGTSAGTATESQSSYVESKRQAESSTMDESHDETYIDKNQDDDLSIASNESEVPKESEDMELGDDEFQTDIEQKKRADNHMQPSGSLILNVNVKLEQLHYAARNGNVDFIRFLLKDQEVRDNLNPSVTKNSPLISAVRGGSLECVQLLIDSGANSKIFFILHEDDSYASNLLHLAIAYGNSELLPLLIKSGIDIEGVTYLGGLTPFLLAAEVGSLACLKVLYQFKANTTVLSICNSKAKLEGYGIGGIEGSNALHLSVSKGRLDTLPFLLQFLTIESRNSDNNTPFLQAVISDNTDIISFLVSEGADIHARNYDGYNAIHLAVREDKHHLVGLLHSLGVSIEERTTIDINEHERFVDCTPLMMAVQNVGWNTWDQDDSKIEPCIHSVVALLEIGANINAKNIQGNTILHMACSVIMDRMHVPFFLVLNGFNYQLENNEKLTASDLVAQQLKEDEIIIGVEEVQKQIKEKKDIFIDFCKKFDKLKPCFNQEHIKALSYYVERNMDGADPLLENVSFIDSNIKKVWEKLKDIFFDFHKETIREASETLHVSITQLKKFIYENIKLCLNAYLKQRQKTIFWEPYMKAQMFGLPPTELVKNEKLKSQHDALLTLPQLSVGCINIIMQYLIGVSGESLTNVGSGPYSEKDFTFCYQEVIFQRFKTLQTQMNIAYSLTAKAGTHQYIPQNSNIEIQVYDRRQYQMVTLLDTRLLLSQSDRYEIPKDFAPWIPAKHSLFTLSSYSLDPKIRAEKMKKEALAAQKLKMTKKTSDSKESKESKEKGESGKLAEIQSSMKSTDGKQAKELKATTAEIAYSAGFGVVTGLSEVSSHPPVATRTGSSFGGSAGSAVGSYLGIGDTGAGVAPSPGSGTGSGTGSGSSSGVHSASGSGSASVLGKRQRSTSPTSLTSVVASSTPGRCLQNTTPMFDNFSVMQRDPKRARLIGPSDTQVSDSFPAMSSQGISAQSSASQLLLMSETATRVSTATPLTMTTSAMETASNVHNVSTNLDNVGMDTRPE